jgi:hemoglobin
MLVRRATNIVALITLCFLTPAFSAPPQANPT